MSEPIRIVITFDPTNGAVNLEGPLNNPLIVYGLLEKARQITQNYEAQQAPRVTPATPSDLANITPFPRTT